MDKGTTRRRFLALAAAGSIAGCLGQGGGTTDRPTGTEDGGSSPASDTDGPGGTATASDDGTNGASGSLPPLADATLPLPRDPSALRDLAVSGGPPKDGIPSIDDPSFEPADEVGSRLSDDAVVFGVVRSGEAKAYPQSILVWHEICNDVVGGDAVAVTYCPLTGTAMGFERGRTTFGVSGRLVNNNLIMYDRATETWWPQVLATSVPGPWNERPGTHSLREFRLVWTTWQRWRQAHPDTLVLTEDTGYARNYDRDPYGSYTPLGGYYTSDTTIFERLNPDDRYGPKRVVLGARTADGAVAFLKDALREKRVLEGSLAGDAVVAVYDGPLDTGYVYRNPEGATFERRDGSYVDGDGTAHEPDALPLESVLAFDAMWFAWSGFYPETSVHA